MSTTCFTDSLEIISMQILLTSDAGYSPRGHSKLSSDKDIYSDP